MKRADVKFTSDSKADFNNLPNDLKSECSQLLRKLEQAGKKLGIPLENKNGKDLRGYYKLYFNNARHRVIYSIVDGKIEITAVTESLKETLEIVGIGARNKGYIYNLIHQRIKEE
ncbi:MAG: hypothetical protein FWH14_04190 [Oscillospiraceae bacterium]|nr:hypothetical protein [Oscillospiraceae bacterium]